MSQRSRDIILRHLYYSIQMRLELKRVEVYEIKINCNPAKWLTECLQASWILEKVGSSRKSYHIMFKVGVQNRSVGYVKIVNPLSRIYRRRLYLQYPVPSITNRCNILPEFSLILKFFNILFRMFHFIVIK